MMTKTAKLTWSLAVVGLVVGLVLGATVLRDDQASTYSITTDGPGIIDLAARADLIALLAVDDVVFMSTDTREDGSVVHRYSLDLATAIESAPVTTVGQQLSGTITVERKDAWSDTLAVDLDRSHSHVLAFITDWSKIGTEGMSLYVVGVKTNGTLTAVDGRVTDTELITLRDAVGEASLVEMLADLGRRRGADKDYHLALPASGREAPVVDALWPDRAPTAADAVAAWEALDRFDKAIDPEGPAIAMKGRVPLQLLINVQGDVTDHASELVYLMDDVGVLHGFALSAKTHSTEIYLLPTNAVIDIARSTDETYPSHSIALADHDAQGLIDGGIYGLELIVTVSSDGQINLEFGRTFPTPDDHAAAFQALLADQGLIREGTPSDG